MKRYHVIKKLSANNEHLNEQDLLPASCKLITGIAVNITVKKEADSISSTTSLAFPQGLIKQLMASDQIANLFYSYMRTRPSEHESIEFFESNLLPTIATTLSEGIQYPILSNQEQEEFTTKLSNLLLGVSNLPPIDWDQRFEDLKQEKLQDFYDFLTLNYGLFGFDPGTDLLPYHAELLFHPVPEARSYVLSEITYTVYYKVRLQGYFGSFSSISRDINTNGNSMLQEYESEFQQITHEKQAYEQTITTGLSHYLFSTVRIFDKGQGLTNLAYANLIAGETLSFLYQKKDSLFTRPIQKYQRPAPYECGSLSLLVNGNSFLLCDYMLTANRKVKHLSEEIIPFSEPLEVNSSLQTVYKSNLKSGTEPLNIRIYIEYEDFKEPLAEVELEKEEAKL